MNLPKASPIILRGWMRATVFCICYAMLFIIAGSIYNSMQPWEHASMQLIFFWSFIMSFIFSMLTVYVFRRAIDRRSFMSMGFEWKGHEQHALAGLLLGVALLAIESLILYFTGHLTWDLSLNFIDLFTGMLIMIFVAISEETVFRGYILNNLLQSINKWVALVISSVVFALFHSGNPGITLLALLNIFLSGLLLGLNYVYTRNLWFAIMFHFSWNYFQGPVLGFEVSGLPLGSFLKPTLTGPNWITGGEFGLEGSVLDGIFSIIAFVLYVLFLQKRSSPKNLNN